MEIRYFLTGQDFWNFQKYNGSRPRRRFQLILICLFSIYLGAGLGLTLNTTAIIALIAPPLGIFFLLSTWSFRQTRRKVDLYLAKEGEHSVIVTPESFQERTLISNITHSWKAFKALTTDKYNLYFFLDSPTIAMAYVIPRHAFASSQDADTFLAWAQSYWAQGHGTQQPDTPGSATGYER